MIAVRQQKLDVGHLSVLVGVFQTAVCAKSNPKRIVVIALGEQNLRLTVVDLAEGLRVGILSQKHPGLFEQFPSVFVVAFFSVAVADPEVDSEAVRKVFQLGRIERLFEIFDSFVCLRLIEKYLSHIKRQCFIIRKQSHGLL